MKKIISLLLAFLITVSLCACGPVGGGEATGSTTAATDAATETTDTVAVDNGFLVGFGYGDITPTESVPLQGYGNHATRMSVDSLSKLYALALVVRDGDGNTAVVISADSASLGTSLCNDIRATSRRKRGFLLPIF